MKAYQSYRGLDTGEQFGEDETKITYRVHFVSLLISGFISKVIDLFFTL